MKLEPTSTYTFISYWAHVIESVKITPSLSILDFGKYSFSLISSLALRLYTIIPLFPTYCSNSQFLTYWRYPTPDTMLLRRKDIFLFPIEVKVKVCLCLRRVFMAVEVVEAVEETESWKFPAIGMMDSSGNQVKDIGRKLQEHYDFGLSYWPRLING